MANINGTAGNDIISGTNKKDTIHGFDGDDLIWGVAGADKLYGDAGNDYLNGMDGNDELFGGDGNDVLIGREGADTLTGGTGADTFKIFDPNWLSGNDGWNWSQNVDGKRDTIMDFNSAEGDKIDLNGLYRYIDTDGDGRTEAYAVTWDDVEIQTLGADQYRVIVHKVDGLPEGDLAIDVIGTVPVQADFIF